jgi:hypothetical protein
VTEKKQYSIASAPNMTLHCFTLWRELLIKGNPQSLKGKALFDLPFSHKQILIDSPKYLARSRAGSESGNPRSTRDCFFCGFFRVLDSPSSSHYRDGFCSHGDDDCNQTQNDKRHTYFEVLLYFLHKFIYH